MCVPSMFPIVMVGIRIHSIFRICYVISVCVCTRTRSRVLEIVTHAFFGATVKRVRMWMFYVEHCFDGSSLLDKNFIQLTSIPEQSAHLIQSSSDKESSCQSE